MSSKNKSGGNHVKQTDNPKTNTTESEGITTKYGRQDTDTERSPQPACFTENEEELKRDILGTQPEPQTTTPSEDNPEQKASEDTTIKQGKYGHLITKEKIQQIKEEPEEESPEPGYETEEFNVKGNVHSEVRFYSRANTNHPDAPETLQEAWRTGVRVGLEHHDRKDFYGYKEARYHEIADVVMVMNSNGMIETTLNVFEESMTVKTDHLIQCGDPSCGRLFEKNIGDRCCHWCGYSESNGRNKTRAELLPKRNSKEKQQETEDSISQETTTNQEHSLDTYCEQCDNTFNTLTRLRLHNCDG